MERFYYSNTISEFINESHDSILGTLSKNNEFLLRDTQRGAWQYEITILKRELEFFSNSVVTFEYTIPRMGKRIDVVLLHQGFVFLFEFKNWQKDTCVSFSSAVEQVTNYALDLKNFHKYSHHCILVPIVIGPISTDIPFCTEYLKEGIIDVQSLNEFSIKEYIEYICNNFDNTADFNAQCWLQSVYMPTPTIIEAAQITTFMIFLVTKQAYSI